VPLSLKVSEALGVEGERGVKFSVEFLYFGVEFLEVQVSVRVRQSVGVDLEGAAVELVALILLQRTPIS